MKAQRFLVVETARVRGLTEAMEKIAAWLRKNDLRPYTTGNSTVTTRDGAFSLDGAITEKGIGVVIGSVVGEKPPAEVLYVGWTSICAQPRGVICRIQHETIARSPKALGFIEEVLGAYAEAIKATKFEMEIAA